MKLSVSFQIYPSLFQLLWHTLIPCYHPSNQSLIKQCYWDGVPVSCAAIVRAVPTDSGMCCAVNLEEGLAESQYSSLVKQMQNEDLERSGVKANKVRHFRI